MEKISKTAKVLDKMLNVVFWLMAIGGGVASVMFVIGAVFSDTSFVSEGVPSLTLGIVNLKLAKDYQLASEHAFSTIMIINAVALLVSVIYICIICRMTRALLKSMIAGKPFDNMVSLYLRKISWTILIGGGITSVLNMIGEIVTISMYNLQELFINDKIVECNIEYIFDYTFLEIFAVVYLLSLIFKYGEELQKQSDETL